MIDQRRLTEAARAAGEKGLRLYVREEGLAIEKFGVLPWVVPWSDIEFARRNVLTQLLEDYAQAIAAMAVA